MPLHRLASSARPHAAVLSESPPTGSLPAAARPTLPSLRAAPAGARPRRDRRWPRHPHRRSAARGGAPLPPHFSFIVGLSLTNKLPYSVRGTSPPRLALRRKPRSRRVRPGIRMPSNPRCVSLPPPPAQADFPAAAAAGRVRTELGPHAQRTLLSADRLVLSPGVPLSAPGVREAIEAGRPAVSELAFGAAHLPLTPLPLSSGTAAALRSPPSRAAAAPARSGRGAPRRPPHRSHLRDQRRVVFCCFCCVPSGGAALLGIIPDLPPPNSREIHCYHLHRAVPLLLRPPPLRRRAAPSPQDCSHPLETQRQRARPLSASPQHDAGGNLGTPLSAAALAVLRDPSAFDARTHPAPPHPILPPPDPPTHTPPAPPSRVPADALRPPSAHAHTPARSAPSSRPPPTSSSCLAPSARASASS